MGACRYALGRLYYQRSSAVTVGAPYTPADAEADRKEAVRLLPLPHD
jgi:hypothetical protein